MPLDIERIQAVLLDIDGTLMDTDDLMVARISSWLHRLPLRRSARDVHILARRIVMGLEAPGNALLGLADRVGLDGPLARLEEAIHRFDWRRAPSEYHLIPNVDRALQTLQPHYPLAIVSARGARGAHAFLEHFNLTPMFQAIVTGQTRPFTKPHPDPILSAASQIGVPVEDCIMVGDTTVDIRSGRAAGAQTIGVLCGFGMEDELRRAGADLILDSTADLPNILLARRERPR